jgi:hypothetical protein
MKKVSEVFVCIKRIMCVNAGKIARGLLMAVAGCMCFMSCDLIEDFFGSEDDDTTTGGKVEKAYKKIKQTADSILLSDDPIAGFEAMAEEYREIKGVKNVQVDYTGLFVEFDNDKNWCWYLPIYHEEEKSKLTSMENIMPVRSSALSTRSDEQREMCIVIQVSKDERMTSIEKRCNEIKETYKNQWNVTQILGEHASVDFFLNKLNQYEMVVIFTHGSFYNPLIGSSKIWLFTGDEVTEEESKDFWEKNFSIGNSGVSAVKEKRNGKMSKHYYKMVSEDDIKKSYKNKPFPQTVIYTNACNGLRTDGLASAFIENGADAVIGWNEINCAGWDVGTDYVVPDLLNGHSLSECIERVPYNGKIGRLNPDFMGENNELHPTEDGRSHPKAELVYCTAESISASEYYLVKTPLLVNTLEVSDRTRTSVTLHGEVVSSGKPVTETGFYYSKNPIPLVNGTKVSLAATSGEFSKNITKLDPAEKYYYVAYAINANGMAYGETKEFTTLDEDGITDDINKIVPKEIQKKMTDIGLPIYGGGNPPTNVTGTYKVSPLILKKSNFSDGYSVGYKFNDVYITFSEQNNDDLTIKFQISEDNGITGEGTGAYIVGEGNKFTIFVEVKSYEENGKYRATTAQIYSGTMTSTGIKDLYNALVMVDDNGNPNLIKDGQGRLFYDSDGLSERVSSSARSASGKKQDLPSVIQSK